MASVGLGLGVGTAGLMKREVAGPVPFRMSGLGSLESSKQTHVLRKGGMLADCSHSFCDCGGP